MQTAVRQKQSVPGMQKQQDSTPENRVSAQYHVPVCSSEKKEKKKGALDKRDEGESRATRIATTRPISLNRGSADFPTCRRIGILPRSRKVQHSRRGVSRGSTDFPLPSKTEAVSASRKTRIIAQTSLSRGPDTPLSCGSKQDRSRRRFKSEGPFTRSVQQNPHRGTEDAVGPPPPVWGGVTPTAKVGAPAQCRADRVVRTGRASRAVRPAVKK